MEYDEEYMRESQYKNGKFINPTVLFDEKWIQVSTVLPDIDDRYWVSNYGRVFDTNVGLCLNPTIQKNGYLSVSLQRKREFYEDHNQHSRWMVIHRLVGMCFIGIPSNPELQINHKDSIKIDNYDGNLEWVTHQENVRYSFEHGNRGVGENSNRVVYSEAQVRQICELLEKGIYDGKTICELVFNSPPLDVHKRLIYDIRNRNFWNSVSKDYTFPPSEPRLKYLTDEQVHMICKYFEDNPYELRPNNKQLVNNVLNNVLHIDPKFLSDSEKSGIGASIKNIKYKTTYKDISSKYNF